MAPHPHTDSPKPKKKHGIQNGIHTKKIKNNSKSKKSGRESIKNSGNSKKSLHQLYNVVPWASRKDWDRISELFDAEQYEGLIQEILIWRERVPALPVGVEATLFLFQALVYDDPTKEPVSEEQARSLYSLAVIRYLNHVSHLATKEMGGPGLPMFKLASHVNVPDWIVNLRHESSHGVTLPSLEILRLAAAFIKSWLKANYWLPVASPTEMNVLSAESLPDDEDKLYSTASEIISAYIACRIYTSRHCVLISDSDITKHLQNQPNKIRTKAATGELKIKILNLFTSSPFVTSCAIAQEMIPNADFYTEFSTLFRNNPFGELLNVWNPLLKLLEKRGKLISLCSQLTEIHVDKNSDDNAQYFSALWLDNLLQRLEAKGSDSSQTLLRRILPVVMMAPNSHSKLFIDRYISSIIRASQKIIKNNQTTLVYETKLFGLVESRLGSTTVKQLDDLASIWMDDDNSSKPIPRPKGERTSKLFTVEDITNSGQTEPTDDDPVNPELNLRGQNRIWSKIPFGAFLNKNSSDEFKNGTEDFTAAL